MEPLLLHCFLRELALTNIAQLRRSLVENAILGGKLRRRFLGLLSIGVAVVYLDLLPLIGYRAGARAEDW